MIGYHAHHLALGIAYHPACPVCNPHPSRKSTCGAPEKQHPAWMLEKQRVRRVRRRALTIARAATTCDEIKNVLTAAGGTG